MKKLAVTAFAALVALTSVAEAAVLAPRTPIVVIDIPAPTVPTTPDVPTTPGTTATPRPSAPEPVPFGASDYDCTIEMGVLRLIRPVQFEDRLYDSIFVQPVCEGERSPGAIRNAGNAGGLRPVLATKSDIVAALADANYVTDEVVGVRFGGGDTLILYVHHINR